MAGRLCDAEKRRACDRARSAPSPHACRSCLSAAPAGREASSATGRKTEHRREPRPQAGASHSKPRQRPTRSPAPSDEPWLSEQKANDRSAPFTASCRHISRRRGKGLCRCLACAVLPVAHPEVRVSPKRGILGPPKDGWGLAMLRCTLSQCCRHHCTGRGVRRSPGGPRRASQVSAAVTIQPSRPGMLCLSAFRQQTGSVSRHLRWVRHAVAQSTPAHASERPLRPSRRWSGAGRGGA